MAEPINVTLTIPSLSDYVGVARLAASGVANRMKFTHEDIEDIKIAVSEACTNAVQYAYGDQIGDINLTFSIFEEALRITVADKGRGFDVKKEPDSSMTQDPDKIGLGLGIVFMKSLMDDVQHTSSPESGTIVTMTKKLQPKSANGL